MANKFKPMLAKQWEPELCTFPKLVSLKLDGIRAVFKDGELLARSLKPIRNKQIQEKFSNITTYSKLGLIFDGEFYSHELTFQEISSVVNSSDKEVPDSLKFHCFDFIDSENYDEEFELRFQKFQERLYSFENVVVLKQLKANSKKDIDRLFEKAIKKDYEGLILRDPKGRYKCGRSTVNEGLLLKVKPFETFDAKVIAIEERHENLNVSQKNELGNSFKRNTKDMKSGVGIASVLVTEYNGYEVKPTLTGTEEFRKEIWDNQEKYIGKMFEYKGMEIGMKDVPRHPTFIRWRVDKDV